jgi:hypothetical protein
MVRLPRWIQLLRWLHGRRERKLPSHEVFSEHVASVESIRRYSTIVDIRSAENGYKLSFETVMILALVLSEGYELFPAGEPRA